jgi:acetylornithine deacetylase/succinyl-diaminopimelate desuccinylase-like protein
MSAELEGIYKHIDDEIDVYIEKYQESVRQRSISQTGDGVMDMAKLMASHFKALGCNDISIHGPLGNPVGQGGTEGNPVVFGRYDAGKEKTLIIYFMYDTMPIFAPEQWSVPPFEARIVDTEKPFPRVLMGRGATNTKGSQMSFLAACYSIIAVNGELPVNLMLIAEGDEERRSMGLVKFVNENVEQLSQADALFFPGLGQNKNGYANPISGSESLLYLDLITGGEHWGRGPTKYNVHGAYKLILDSPAWRHIQMLSSITSEDGNKILIDDWYDDLVTEQTAEDSKMIDEMIEKGAFDIELIKEGFGVDVFIDDIEDPRKLLTMQLYGTSFNLDGIYGGRMTPGAGAVMPLKLTSKHNIRFNANPDANELVMKLRRHLDNRGYTDVKIDVVGVMDWCLNNWDHGLAGAVLKMYEEFNVGYVLKPPTAVSGEMAPAWPAYLFGKSPLRLPIMGGSLGHGGRAHTVDEYYVIEGTGKVHGFPEAIKGCASVLFNYASNS